LIKIDGRYEFLSTVISAMWTMKVWTMKRYFFDYRAKNEWLLDYRGHEFPTAASALDFAQETVQNLKHSLAHDWSAWCVEVRAADGEKYFSFPVGHELAA
jgi:hypothetical protein